MNHLVAHATAGTLLFHDWIEARELWDRIVAALPGLLALCLMPNHFHSLHGRATEVDLQPVLGAYARWRNCRRGESGPVWERPIPPPTYKEGAQKIRGDERYVHLNPVRGRLVTDPLGWAFSTHRDAVGLAAFPVRKTVPDPVEFHRSISDDVTCRVGGTFLPTAPHYDPTLEAVHHAVSAVSRTPLSLLEHRGPERTLLVRALRRLTTATLAEISDATRLSRRQVSRIAPANDAAVRAVHAVIGDPRFPALFDENLLHRWRGWRRP